MTATTDGAPWVSVSPDMLARGAEFAERGFVVSPTAVVSADAVATKGGDFWRTLTTASPSSPHNPTDPKLSQSLNRRLLKMTCWSGIRTWKLVMMSLTSTHGASWTD